MAFHQDDFIFGEAVEVIDEAVDLAVGGGDLGVELGGGLRIGLGAALGDEGAREDGGLER